MARSLLFPDVDDFMEIAYNKANYEFPMKVLNIQPGDRYEGKLLKDSGISQDGFICISFKSPDDRLVFAPPAETLLLAGSELLLLGSGTERALI